MKYATWLFAAALVGLVFVGASTREYQPKFNERFNEATCTTDQECEAYEWMRPALERQAKRINRQRKNDLAAH